MNEESTLRKQMRSVNLWCLFSFRKTVKPKRRFYFLPYFWRVLLCAVVFFMIAKTLSFNLGYKTWRNEGIYEWVFADPYIPRISLKFIHQTVGYPTKNKRTTNHSTKTKNFFANLLTSKKALKKPNNNDQRTYKLVERLKKRCRIYTIECATKWGH